MFDPIAKTQEISTSEAAVTDVREESRVETTDSKDETKSDVRQDSKPAQLDAMATESMASDKQEESKEIEPVRAEIDTAVTVEQEFVGNLSQLKGESQVLVGKDVVDGNQDEKKEQEQEENVESNVKKKAEADESIVEEAEPIKEFETLEGSIEKREKESLAAGDTHTDKDEEIVTQTTETEELGVAEKEREPQKTESELLQEKLEEDKLIAEILSSNPASQVALFTTQSATSANAAEPSPKITPRSSRPGTPKTKSSVEPVSSTLIPSKDDTFIRDAVSPAPAISRTSRPDSPRPASPDPAIFKSKSSFSAKYTMLEPTAVSPVPEVDSVQYISPKGSFQQSNQQLVAVSVDHISSTDIDLNQQTPISDSAPDKSLEELTRPVSPVPPNSHALLEPAASPVQAESQLLEPAASPVPVGSQELQKPTASPVPVGSQELQKPTASPVQAESQELQKPTASPVQAESQLLEPATSPVPVGSQELQKPTASLVPVGSQELLKPAASPVPVGSQELQKPAASPVQAESQELQKPAASPELSPKPSQQQKLADSNSFGASTQNISQQNVAQFERVQSLIDAEHRPPTPPADSNIAIGERTPGQKPSLVPSMKQEPSFQSVREDSQCSESLKQSSTSNIKSSSNLGLKSSASTPNSDQVDVKVSNTSARSGSSSSTSPKTSSTNAKTSLASTKGSVTSAKNSTMSAKASTTSAKAALGAKGSITSAKSNTTGAKASSTSAKASDTNQKASTTNAKSSNTSAKVSTTSVKASTTNSKATMTGTKASKTSTKSSTTSAKISKTNTKASTTSAKASTTSAKASTTSAKASTTSARVSTTNAKASTTSAKASTTNTTKKKTSTSNIDSKTSEKSVKFSTSKSLSKERQKSSKTGTSSAEELTKKPSKDKSSTLSTEQVPVTADVDPAVSVEIVIQECSPNKLSDSSLISGTDQTHSDLIFT
ncbi:uncharacterized protein [Ptychodera flava]|uniref:uncharacterized protein n=1 Tax=Ptychodera flava TaxID=63121 RepID=UPI00396AAF87